MWSFLFFFHKEAPSPVIFCCNQHGQIMDFQKISYIKDSFVYYFVNFFMKISILRVPSPSPPLIHINLKYWGIRIEDFIFRRWTFPPEFINPQLGVILWFNALIFLGDLPSYLHLQVSWDYGYSQFFLEISCLSVLVIIWSPGFSCLSLGVSLF